MTTTSRRNVLTGTAASLAAGAAINLAAVAVARAAEPDDPIFAAIERYKRAHAFHGECIDKVDADEADESLSVVGMHAELDALAAMLQTPPVTTSGALALIQLVQKEAESRRKTTLGMSFSNQDALPFLRSMAAFLERMAVAS